MRMRTLVALFSGASGLALLATALACSPRPAPGLVFDERVVAGGEADFMTVRHLVLRGTNFEIGKKLGEIAKARHHTQLPKGDPFMTPLRHAFFRDQYPAHFQRMQGAAAAFGVDLDPHCSVVFYPL